MKKTFFKILIFLSVIVCFQKIYEVYATGFCLSNIRYEETIFEPKIYTNDAESQIERIKPILNQPYTYLGKGNQSFAFESTDGCYVIKFFKFGHLKKSIFANFLPKIPYFEKQIHAQEKRFIKVFDGYQIAYTENKENAALLYIHLNKTSNLKTNLIVKDLMSLSHTINLDDVVFVLQEKVIPTKAVLTTLFDQGDILEAINRINQLFSLYIDEYQKGIYDRDHNLIYNTGFIKDRAIRLDVGKLRKNEEAKNPEFYTKDLEKIAFERIDRWMKKYYPKYRNEIVKAMIMRLNKIQAEITHAE